MTSNARIYTSLALCLWLATPVLASADPQAEPAAKITPATAPTTTPTTTPAAISAAAPAAEPPSLSQELSSGFYSRINILGFSSYQSLAEPPLDLNLTQIPRSQTALTIRPDFGLNWRQFEFGFKPRFQYVHNRIDLAPGIRVDDNSQEWFVNEAFVRYRMTDKLIAIYGRENLQWGPSSLLSPSNPFNPDNGKSNPNLEQPGADYIRLLAIPNSAFTLSLIANTGAGRKDLRGPFYGFNPLGVFDSFNTFRKTYAVKVDYTGDGHYFSLIASKREQDPRRLGFFGGWNASEALLLYLEGSLAPKNDSLLNNKRDDQLLLGGAYTFEAGPTATVEYFRNENGCTLSPVSLCLLQQAVLIDPRYPLLGRRYVLLQMINTKIAGKLNLVLRAVRNLDDHSLQASANLEYELGQHWQLSMVPTLFHGGSDTEFGSALRRYLFVGLSYTF
jgi:hypothetical protein